MVAIGEDLVGDKANAILDFARPSTALYVGGMGARDKNFYNTIMQKYGYVDEAIAIQDNYLAGDKDKAASLVPGEMLANTNLVGPKSLRQGAPRRVQRSRSHPPQRQRRRQGPGVDHRGTQDAAALSGRRAERRLTRPCRAATTG